MISHPKYFYRHGVESISYNNVLEISLFLTKHPGAIQAYTVAMTDLANVHAACGDYRGMRETLNFLVDVRVQVAELRGEKYLS